MKITVAGKDRTGDVGHAIQARAATFAPISNYGPSDSALSLREAANEDKYVAKFNTLLRHHRSIKTDIIPVSQRGGMAGRVACMFKKVLWRLLRHQHDRIAAQQNAINELLVMSFVLQYDAYKRKIEAIERRLADIEKALHRRQQEDGC